MWHLKTHDECTMASTYFFRNSVDVKYTSYLDVLPGYLDSLYFQDVLVLSKPYYYPREMQTKAA